MIYIVESKPYRVTGSSSLLVWTDNPQEKFYNIIEGCEVQIYLKTKCMFEVPIVFLSYLLDNLTYLDDIRLKLMEDDKRLVQPLKPILEYKSKPFQHQIDGITYGLNHDKWLLLDTMGLGKTYQIINLARELKAQKGLQHCLVICGVNSLKNNWKQEIALHSDETCRVLGEKISRSGRVTYGRIKDRADELKNQLDQFFIITNVESFRNEEMIKAFRKSKNKIDMIVIDEIHCCKNKNSQQGFNLLKLDAKYKIGATGTLLLNSPIDAYVPLSWTHNDMSNLTNFKKVYCQFGGFGGREIQGFKNMDLLKDEIESCSLRRTKDLLDLPERTIINEVVEMDEKQTKFYEDVENGVKKDVDKIKLNTSNLLSLLIRLRQATACPSMLSTKDIDSIKIDRCVELVEEIVSNGEKVVIMSTFVETLDKLMSKLESYKPLLCIGDTKDEDVEKYKKMFQEDDEHYVMVATWKKMGTGHTLHRANYMIFLDTPWTYGLFDQNCDRIHRIGQHKPVFIYNLVCKGTVDEKIAYILSKKRAVSDFIVDDKMTDDEIKILKDYILDL